MRTLKPQVARCDLQLRWECWTASAKIFSTRTVDTFATCGFSVRMRKYAQCGPRLTLTLTLSEFYTHWLSTYNFKLYLYYYL